MPNIKQYLAALLFLMVTPLLAGTVSEPYNVVLPYDPVAGCQWVCEESAEGIVRCVSSEVTPHEWEEGRENITYSFQGLQEGIVDLTFRYVPNGDAAAEAENAWRIRLSVDADGKITEESYGAYEVGFHSFDGGGPEYEVTLSDETVVHYYQHHEYSNPDHDLMCGSAYQAVCGFTGRRPGSTDVTVTEILYGERSVAAQFTLDVDENLCVTRRMNGELCQLEFYHYGFEIPHGYYLTKSDDGLYTKASISDRGLELEGDLPRTLLDDLQNVLQLNDVAAWDGFHETDPNVLDGEGFSFYAVYTDGMTISASGSNAFPENYSVVAPLLDDMMQPYIDACRAEYYARPIQSTDLELFSLSYETDSEGSDYEFSCEFGTLRDEEEPCYFYAVVDAREFGVEPNDASGTTYQFYGPVSNPPFAQLQELIERYDAESWNGYDARTNENLDQPDFELLVEYSSGESIQACGRDNPDGFEAFRDQVTALLLDYIRDNRDSFVPWNQK